MSEVRHDDGHSLRSRLWTAGRTSWALLGIAGILAVVLYLMSLVPLVMIPLVLALFPATLLVPVASRLCRWGWPPALAAVTSLLAGIALLAALIGAMVPLVAAELPALAESAGDGVADIDRLLERQPFGLEVGGVSELLDRAQDALPGAGEMASQALGAAVVAFETVAGVLLMVVLLFFYLKDGRRLAEGLASVAPQHLRSRTWGVMERSWETLGAFFRGQMVVALVDAVAIGLGLVLLGVPLALPLAVLIFFGGLFPIVGAVATGALAVLVALADAGLVTALIVLALVLAVQQLESNILEPMILGRAIRLHPVMVLVSITTGAVLLGILGAFLAVPVAAIVARSVEYLREESEASRDRDIGDAETEPDDAGTAARAR